MASDVLASGDESIERDGMEQLHRVLNDLSDIPHTTKPAPVRRNSRDFFWYRPVLNRQLHDCSAEAVISPRDEADVIRIAAGCFRHNVPITARGGCSVPIDQCLGRTFTFAVVPVNRRVTDRLLARPCDRGAGKCIDRVDHRDP